MTRAICTSLALTALWLAAGCASDGDKNPDSGPAVDTVAADTTAPDTAAPDTAAPDTAVADAAPDAAGDLAVADGASDGAGDGTTTDGAMVDGATTDAAAADGAIADQSTGDGTMVDGTMVDGTMVDGATDATPPDLGSLGDLFPPPPDGAPQSDGPQYGCGPVGFEGCCRGGVLYYCDGTGLLLVADCAANPSCGWDGFYELYDCGTDGKADPTGTHPLTCPF